MRILHIDGDDDRARIVSEEVASIVRTSTLEDGIEAARRSEFDVALLDLGVADSPGIDTLSRFRELHPALPIVVLLEEENGDLARLAVARGAQDYLAKEGLSERLIIRTLRHACERSRLMQQLDERTAEADRARSDLRLAFESAAAGIVLADPDGRLEYANPAFCRMVGYELEELRALDYIVLTHPSDREESRRLFGGLMRGERDSFVQEKRYLTREGAEVSAHVSVSALERGAGKPTRVVAFAENTTERSRARERAEESERLIRLAGGVARVGGWYVDLPTGIAHMSDVVCEIHGLPHGTTFPVEAGLEYYAPDSQSLVRAAFERCVETGEPWDLDLEIDTARGDRVWVRSMGEAVRNEDEEITRVWGAFQDITHHKMAEAAALESDAAFHILAEAMPHMVWSANAEGAVDYMTSRMVEFSGRSMDEILGWGWMDLVHPDDVPGAVADWEAAASEAAPYRSEFRFRRRDGVYCWHVAQAQPVLDDDGAVLRWYGSAIDVHDRRLMEEEARRLAHRLKATFESITDAVLTIGRDWRITYVNTQAEQLLGRSRDELLDRDIWDAFPEERGSAFQREYERAFRDDVPVRLEEYYQPIDSWLQVAAYPSDEGLAIFFRDVTQERATQERIRVSEERFRTVARVTSDVIWDWDLATDEVWWSEGLRAAFGYDSATMPSNSESRRRMVHPEDVDRVRAGIREAIDGHVETWEDQYRLVCVDGRIAQVSDRGFIVRDDEGRGLRMVGGVSDETERLEAIETLRQQAELLDRARDAIMVLELDDSIAYWNAGATRTYGWESSEAVGRSVLELLYDDPELLEAATTQVRDAGEWTGEVQHLHRDGSRLWVECRWSLVRDDEANPRRILAIHTDITEKKKLTAQFLRAQRMESIGTLAGGIAHDLNNVLAPILLSIELLKTGEWDDPEARRETLETIEASATRGAEMVQQVLVFARGVEGSRVSVDLHRVVAELGRVVRDTFPKNIGFETSVPDHLWRLAGDPTQVHQVLLNLFVNARDAMAGGGGTLGVSAENLEIDEQYSTAIPNARPGRYVCISVEDTGAGIPGEIIDQIFDPFFTTKEVGGGTGLGLSTVDAIVRSHGGFVNVYSEPHQGTKFRVYLPASTTDHGHGEEPRSAIPLGQGELILVVDDETAVREITRRTLEAFGFRVVTATDGADAVDIYRGRGEEIHAVLTDIMMPVMDGIATIRALRAMDPDVRIIAASGLGTDQSVARVNDAGVQHFLPKPYTAGSLLSVLHDVLHDDAPGGVAP
ncbi:PAS domain S-box protein [Gaopeijia maritima]|uniref:PAS domain S-box protein n=1 Tax=Gaopeijia maritima TaxID=3119007 RepID=UPI003281A4A0